MSLRDQLLKAGVVSSKDARRADQQARLERKQKQGARDKAREVRAREEAERKAAVEAAAEQRRAERSAREAEKGESEHELRVRHVVEGNRLGHRGRVPFWHRRLDGRRLHRLEVDQKVAWMLRCGEAAIAGLPGDASTGESYHVISAKGAQKLEALAPDVLVFYVREVKGISDKDEAFLQRSWDPSLAPHRIGDAGGATSSE